MKKPEFEAAPHTQGMNVYLKLLFIRHAKKDPITGELSQEGRQQASTFFPNSFDFAPGTKVEIFHSPISRSEETAKIIASSLPNNTLNGISLIDELTEAPYTDEEVDRLGIGGGKWLEEEKPAEELPSTKIIASRIADIVLGYAETSRILDQGANKSIIFVSHIPPLMLFLKWHFAQELELEKGTILEGLGGFIEPLKGFEIAINRKDPSNLNMVLEYNTVKNGIANQIRIFFDEAKLRG